MAGFIYIISNPAYSRIKIGKSAKDPTKDRASELYQTGVPEPMKVEYFALVEDENLLERLVHQHFHASRPNKGRAFFDLDVPTAIKGIRELAAERSPILHEKVFHVYDDGWDEDLLDEETEDDLDAEQITEDVLTSAWVKAKKTPLNNPVYNYNSSGVFRGVFIFICFTIIYGVILVVLEGYVGAEATDRLAFPTFIYSVIICWLIFMKRSTNKKPTPPKQNKGLMREVWNSFLTRLFWASVIIISFVLLVYLSPPV